MSAPWQVSRESLPPTSRLLIERAHEELLAGNLDDRRLQEVRPLVRESWERSWRGRVGPEGAPPLELVSDELEAYRLAHPLASAMDMIRALLLPGEVEDTGVIIAVGDQAGRLLWIEGDSQLRSLTDGMGFVAGANWSEDSVGTSAPGTALALGQSVQIHGAEHYNRLVHPWSCTAAPVRDPETQRVLGVIDITGGPEVVSLQARLLVDATARAVESELMVARLRERSEAPRARSVTTKRRSSATARATLHVLGRDRARLETESDLEESVIELSARHAAILLMLGVHRQGLSAERLCELVYGSGVSPDTLRPEMVRLRKVLERTAPDLVPDSRPYRLPVPLDTDAHDVLSLLDRGAHRVALTAYRGPVLPESTSPGVEEFRESVRAALREAMLSEASLDVLLSYAEIPEGQGDAEALRLALEMLPARSPKRAGLVARIERLES
ncbi:MULTISPECIES: GAF domain-containing protein [unclassified Microbacterium]|uniref:GAF domain-containing protein n=1 Tax=unclassified Microbacterium TaxID=2609290 RepID=UPI000CFB5C0A|nr:MULTISPECIES: GAF domain-containing protein [unclassified Microbacterium]PQZ58072.1 transcriptional regulator [Microbacterium sp. MYb43]PQZ80713.1 transcriptional regulator [Microbacterium sp. MYb40]PRB20359.1 transcriptional regulator [Microbacterium sp. MYb54]PRB32030.1 transcriptional regulator [Microbacterium sp. MYb50]PRB66380.1 transcriptional regulator [Microbacterium sp. MYb24]